MKMKFHEMYSALYSSDQQGSASEALNEHLKMPTDFGETMTEKRIDYRVKGSSGEREVCNLIRGYCGVRMVRNLEQVRSGGYDLIVHPDEVGAVADQFRKLAIEVKRYRRTSPSLIDRWWIQATRQADAAKLVAVLICRADRQPWEVAVPLSWIDDGLSNEPVRMGLQAFMGVVRASAGSSWDASTAGVNSLEKCVNSASETY